ncbi:MAG: restriction endonuclease subunit R, partial [Candidatus Nomurabacteria bacterium]|nr:restriction endonuclease subunit R [Candidatus Nomurabacteria bacterium]
CSKCGKDPCECESKPPRECSICGQNPCICEKGPKICPVCGKSPCECDNQPRKKLKIKLRDGKEREIQHMISTSFWGADGRPLSSEEFITKIYGVLPEFFKNEEELRKIWSNPVTRKEFLNRLFDMGIDLEQLDNIQRVVNGEDCDLFDVLSYLSYNTPLITRQQRVDNTKENIFEGVDENNKEFLDFVISKYQEKGVEELGEEKLSQLLNLKYKTVSDAINILGDVGLIRSTFFDFQEHLYAKV